MKQETLFAFEPEDQRSLAMASAGTGKTFQLTNRLIALLARGEAPSSILATTFTRHAAAEILHRLLGRLAGAALGGAALEELRAHVDASLTQERCRELLMTVSRQLHRLNIGTLDAFFFAMASSYALELGLGPAWRLMDDAEDDALRLEAVDAALERVRAAHGNEEMAALFRLLHGGDPARSVAEALLRQVDGVYDVFIDAPTEAWEHIGPLHGLMDDAALKQAIAALRDAPLPLTQGGTEHRRWVTAFENLAAAASAGRWEDFVGSTVVQSVLDEEFLFCRLPIDDDHQRAIEPLLRHAGAVILAELAGRNRATRELLSHFHDAYTELKRARSRYRFDDLPRLLRGPLEAGALDELYFRLDGRVLHLLLDEFQDTSMPQYRLLRPMLDELLSQDARGRTVYIVGDPKQSLYSWRSAEPRLLPSLRAHYETLTEEILIDNYRSSQIVLDAVDTVFAGLDGNLAMVGHMEVAGEFAAAFKTPRAARKLPGAVNLIGVGPFDRGADRTGPCNEATADIIAGIAAEAPGASVGVLVRVRKRIAPLLEALRARGIQASEEGGSALMDTPAGAAAIALLLLADHPDHIAAALRVATSPLGKLVGLRDPADGVARRRAAALVRRRIDSGGYGDTLDWMLRAVALETDARGVARMAQLVALGDQLDGAPPARIAEAARMLAATRVSDPRDARVRVMTIHASKGLQFDAVVLPDLCERMTGRGSAVLLNHPEPLRAARAVSCSLAEPLRKLHPDLQRMAQRDEQRVVQEGLCLLYVAMTRAARRLDMIVELDKPTSSATSPTGARVLLGAFPPDPDALMAERDPGRPVALWGAARGIWHEGLKAEAAVCAPVAPPAQLAPAARPPWRLARRSPSRREDRAARSLRPASAASETGRLVHAWMEQVEWIEDGLPQDAALIELAAAAGRRTEDAQEHLARLRAALQAPAIRELLSREATRARAPAAVDTLELRREWPFALREGDALVQGRIDRLVIGRRAGRAVWAEIIDFKTDAPDARVRCARTEQASAEGDDAATLAHHADQMNAYRAAVCRALAITPDCAPVAMAMLRSGTVLRQGKRRENRDQR